jgi:hypothetical protein
MKDLFDDYSFEIPIPYIKWFHHSENILDLIGANKMKTDIFKPGDIVTVNDGSYSLRLVNEIGPGNEWRHGWEDFIFKKKLMVIETGLKVPVLQDRGRKDLVKRDMHDRPIYLDIMLQDENEDIWLTLVRFCSKCGEDTVGKCQCSNCANFRQR